MTQKDSLTPLERLTAIREGRSIDRLRCIPVLSNTTARVIGAKVSELRSDGKRLAEASIAAYRRFGYDVVRVFTDLYIQPEAMGSTVRVPEDETAHLDAPAIHTAAEIDRLRPHDPRKDGHLPQLLEALWRTQEALGHEVPVSCAVMGPFTLAALLVGAEELSRWTVRNPQAAHRLLEVAFESSRLLTETILDGGGSPSLTDAMSSTTVISPRHFREFSFPYLKRLADFIIERGKPVSLHICGRTAPIWKDMADTGATCLSIDNMANLADAKVAVGDRVCLMGNVPPSEVLLQGTPADVRRAVRIGVAQAWDNPKGYIIASGCSLPTETPFANIDAMMDAAREIGWPVDPTTLVEEIEETATA
jgi:uroporphyrinogen decarboxylase